MPHKKGGDNNEEKILNDLSTETNRYAKKITYNFETAEEYEDKYEKIEEGFGDDIIDVAEDISKNLSNYGKKGQITVTCKHVKSEDKIFNYVVFDFNNIKNDNISIGDKSNNYGIQLYKDDKEIVAFQYANHGKMKPPYENYYLNVRFPTAIDKNPFTVDKLISIYIKFDQSGGRHKPVKIPFGVLKQGDLTNFGYSTVKSLSAAERHRALDKAIKDHGALDVMRKLNLLMVLNKNTNVATSKIFERDRNWVQKNYLHTK